MNNNPKPITNEVASEAQFVDSNLDKSEKELEKLKEKVKLEIEKKNKKVKKSKVIKDPGISIRLLLTFLLFIFVFIIAFTIAYQSIKSKPKADEIKFVPKAEIKLPKLDEEEGSKVFSNSNFSFEFDYPYFYRIGELDNLFYSPSRSFMNIFVKEVYAAADYFVYSPVPTNRAVNVYGVYLQDPNFDMNKPNSNVGEDNPSFFQASKYNLAPLGVFINVWENNSGSNLDNLFLQLKEKKISKKKVGENTVLVVGENCIYSDESLCPTFVWGHEATIFVKGDYFYSIFYASEEYKDFYQDLVSSFRFINE